MVPDLTILNINWSLKRDTLKSSIHFKWNYWKKLNEMTTIHMFLSYCCSTVLYGYAVSVTQHRDCTSLHGAVKSKAECGWSSSSCIYLTLPCPLASYSCPLPTTTAAHITTATLVFPLWVHLPAEKGSCCCNPTPWSTPMGILVFPVPSIFSMKFLCLTAFHEVEQRRGGERQRGE